MSSLSVVIPCLNEAKTLRQCIGKARTSLQKSDLDFWEIIVADNGSTDESIAIAHEENVILIAVQTRGYGAALHAGIMGAKTAAILFADADESYDFGEIDRFIAALKQGADLVVGNRFSGKIHEGAMPFLHRYLGTPVISFIGRKSFGVSLGDFNCGMRAITISAYHRLNMQSPGMEYASEMIAKAGLLKMKISEVPVSLYKDGRNRKPHLRTWQDGWKHLRLMLLLSPKWRLLFPALFFLITGSILGSLLAFSYVKVFNLVLDIHTLYYASIFFIVGFQLLQMYVIARLFGSRTGLYPAGRFSKLVYNWFGFEKGLIIGGGLLLLGFSLSIFAITKWGNVNFGPLDPVYVFRIIIPAGFCIALGMQLIVFGFLMYTLQQLELNSNRNALNY